MEEALNKGVRPAPVPAGRDAGRAVLAVLQCLDGGGRAHD
jgi:hypothetical protein